MGFEELECCETSIICVMTVRIVIFNRCGLTRWVCRWAEKYPTNGEELIRNRAGKLIALDGQAKARELGSPRVMNIILLGVLIRELGLQDIDWNRIIAENVKKSSSPSTSRRCRWE